MCVGSNRNLCYGSVVINRMRHGVEDNNLWEKTTAKAIGAFFMFAILMAFWREFDNSTAQDWLAFIGV